MREHGMSHGYNHVEMGDIVLPTSPLRFHDSPSPVIEPEPAVGEHASAILSDWLGLAEVEINRLRQMGAIGAEP